MHGNLSQKERNISMNRFRNGRENVLVATDIAARGIDVPSVGHIINYDLPIEPMMYFHRIGRTARAGATGNAVSLVTPERLDDFARILRNTKQPIHKLNDERESQFLLFQNNSINLVLRPDHLKKSNKNIIEIVVEAKVVLNFIKMKATVLEKKEKRIVMADMTKD